ncbi:2-dehydropantoate 2-reductase [Anaeromyxobacter diazotrophicus]|uniref:2-dehydropantoate 2-reductase n=1 Tax=Anaeromyxobacter diazotrophicus TaxID=2590199 RepID=A0A7I9VQL5_9BACT|nr:2-dehydropantoate 2-reductase [Anaeromyxobacter diazotrophicus]GEJ58548.1 2-dehydropantoate 2-reductase [Anaeromyxobacter diazotrophicus]
MRVAVVGAGGVGGLIGGLLARAGHEVAFVARGATLAALRERGLEVESPRGTFRVAPVEASDDPGALRPAEAVLVAVKGWQVREVAPRLAPLLAPGGLVLPLENGVEAAPTLARALGEERVVGGLCHLFAWTEAPGVVKHAGDLLRVTMGERRGGSSARLERLAAALREAKVDAVISPDIEAAAWEKFLFIDAFGSVGAVTRAPVGVVRTLPESRALLRAAMEETAAVGRARGVRLTADAVEKALALIDAVKPESTASMQRDIQGGRPSELFDQPGAVVRLAAEAGVDAPVHRFLYAALLPQETAARGPARPVP